MFSKHHYLDANHNNSAVCYVLFVNDVIAGFISILHFPHPKVKNLKKVHRLVILPDFQGISLGIRLLNEVANLYNNYRFNIVTSSPSLIQSLKRLKNWKCTRFGRVSSNKKGVLKNTTSSKRITASFEYVDLK